MLAVEGLQSALSSVCCKECGTGSITFQENFQRQQCFYTAPSLICDTCAKVTPIPFAVHQKKVAERLELDLTPLCKHFLQAKDIKRIEKSKYKNSDRAKYLRRAARRKRKGFDDRHQQQEGVMYSSGAFGNDVPGPSKRARN